MIRILGFEVFLKLCYRILGFVVVDDGVILLLYFFFEFRIDFNIVKFLGKSLILLLCLKFERFLFDDVL